MEEDFKLVDQLPSDVLILIFSNLSLEELFLCSFVNNVFRRNAKFPSLRLVTIPSFIADKLICCIQRDRIFDLGLKELDRQDYKSAVVR